LAHVQHDLASLASSDALYRRSGSKLYQRPSSVIHHSLTHWLMVPACVWTTQTWRRARARADVADMRDGRAWNLDESTVGGGGDGGARSYRSASMRQGEIGVEAQLLELIDVMQDLLDRIGRVRLAEERRARE